jgi:hypothetical protein
MVTWRTCLLVLCIFALVACKPPSTVPRSGHVNLRYSGENGSQEFRFSLENGSPNPVRLLGWSSMWSDTLPDVYFATCTSENSISTAIGPGFLHPPRPESESIEVLPGRALRLVVPSRSFSSMAAQGRCRLELTLQDGSKIESNEFDPTP